MSSCDGCYNYTGKVPDPEQKLCSICIRNPKFPTMKMPEKTIIEGIELTIPQDMFIATDRGKFEEQLFEKKLTYYRDILKRRIERPTSRPWLLEDEKTAWYEEYIHKLKGKKK